MLVMNAGADSTLEPDFIVLANIVISIITPLLWESSDTPLFLSAGGVLSMTLLT